MFIQSFHWILSGYTLKLTHKTFTIKLHWYNLTHLQLNLEKLLRMLELARHINRPLVLSIFIRFSSKLIKTTELTSTFKQHYNTFLIYIQEARKTKNQENCQACQTQLDLVRNINRPQHARTIIFFFKYLFEKKRKIHYFCQFVAKQFQMNYGERKSLEYARIKKRKLNWPS